MLNDLVFVLNHIKSLIETYSRYNLYVSIATTLKQIVIADTSELQKALTDYKTKTLEL